MQERKRNGGDVEESGKWSDAVMREVFSAVQGDVFWRGYLMKLSSQKEIRASVHLAILREPYLDFILRGEKTVESRFSSRQCSPYKRVAAGDILVLKRQSGPVLGLCRVAHAWFYELDPESWKTIREEFTAVLRAEDPEFWRDRAGASFATLMSMDHITRLPPISCGKRDRRGWVTLRALSIQGELWNR